MKNTTRTDIIVVGFNARPLAAKVKDAGFQPHVIDFFGDVDTRGVATRGWYYVDQPAPRHDGPGFRRWVQDQLPGIACTVSACEGSVPSDKPFLVIGSGFDDATSAWHLFWEHGTVLGNRPEAVAAARDVGCLRTVVDGASRDGGFDARVPGTRHFQLRTAADIPRLCSTIASEFDMPLVIKVKHTAGGAGVVFITSSRDLSSMLETRFQAREYPDAPLDFLVQEYIHPLGDRPMTDASALMLDGNVLCTTRQVIGDGRLNAPGRFTYCGNEIPFSIPARARLAVGQVGRALHERIGLRGLWGFDFGLSGDTITVFEVNPRVPGSMEPASLATGVNLMGLHVASFTDARQGAPLPGRLLPKVVNCACKYVLFAARPLVMPSLQGAQQSFTGTLHDVSLPGQAIPGGAPLLTYLLVQAGTDAPFRDACRDMAMREVQSIYRLVSGSA